MNRIKVIMYFYITVKVVEFFFLVIYKISSTLHSLTRSREVSVISDNHWSAREFCACAVALFLAVIHVPTCREPESQNKNLLESPEFLTVS